MHATMYGLKLRMLHGGCLCDVWCCVRNSNIDNNIIQNCWYILAMKERLRKKIISAAKTKLYETTPKDVVFATVVCSGLNSLPGMDINWIKTMLKLFIKFATCLFFSINYIFNPKEYFNYFIYQHRTMKCTINIILLLPRIGFEIT